MPQLHRRPIQGANPVPPLRTASTRQNALRLTFWDITAEPLGDGQPVKLFSIRATDANSACLQAYARLLPSKQGRGLNLRTLKAVPAR
jgi:hypothetical protein